MPVPTPPNKDLFKVAPRKDTQKLSKDIRNMTEAIKDDKNTVEVPRGANLRSVSLVKEVDLEKGSFPTTIKKYTPKTERMAPSEHLSQSPFRDNEAMRNLQRELSKEKDPKQPIKRSPRRKPATKTTGEK